MATEPILIEELRFAYPPLAAGSPAPWIIDNLDLRVGQGEWLAVMGPSDAGKTTLCLLLAGLAPYLTGGTMEGRILIGGLDPQEHPPPALAGEVGILFQEPDTQLFNSSVEAEVAWGLENLGLPVAQIRARVDEMLALLHLEQVRQRAPGELSGGEKKRLALASVLAMRPSLLILDEPMGGLDPVGRTEVLAALRRTALAEYAILADGIIIEGGRAPGGEAAATTIVMTESDPEAVAAFADRLVILNQGQIALEGRPQDLFCQTERLAELGVAIPVMARLSADLNRRLAPERQRGAAPEFAFLTVDTAYETLAAHLG